jgi:hypothetical protein
LAAAAAWGCGPGDDRPATWSYISPAIIQGNCATSSCHGPTAAVAGLDLSTAEKGWNGLLRQKLPEREKGYEANRPMVIPFNPDQSRVVNMLRARGANRMPPDRPLAEADIVLIESWILAGAKND